MTRTLTLPEWDQLVAPALHRIESLANAIKGHGNICLDYTIKLQNEVRYLTSRPEWETRAVSELREAAKTISTVADLLCEVADRIAASDQTYAAIKSEKDRS